MLNFLLVIVLEFLVFVTKVLSDGLFFSWSVFAMLYHV